MQITLGRQDSCEAVLLATTTMKTHSGRCGLNLHFDKYVCLTILTIKWVFLSSQDTFVGDVLLDGDCVCEFSLIL